MTDIDEDAIATPDPDDADYLPDPAEELGIIKKAAAKAGIAPEHAHKIYQLLSENGIEANPETVPVHTARRILETVCGIEVVLPYNYVGSIHAPSPVVYRRNTVDRDMLERICVYVEEKGSLRQALRTIPGAPGEGIFYAWVGGDDAAYQRYARAKETCGEWIGWEVGDISDGLLEDESPTRERIAAARVAIEGKKFLAERLAPASWGINKVGGIDGESFVKALETIEKISSNLSDRRGRQAGGSIIDVTPDNRLTAPAE